MQLLFVCFSLFVTYSLTVVSFRSCQIVAGAFRLMTKAGLIEKVMLTNFSAESNIVLLLQTYGLHQD